MAKISQVSTPRNLYCVLKLSSKFYEFGGVDIQFVCLSGSKLSSEDFGSLTTLFKL